MIIPFTPQNNSKKLNKILKQFPKHTRYRSISTHGRSNKRTCRVRPLFTEHATSKARLTFVRFAAFRIELALNKAGDYEAFN